MGFWQLSFDLGPLDPNRAEESCFNLGASAVTFVDAHDDPVLEPLPGEFRLWPATRVQALFAADSEPERLARALSGALGIGVELIRALPVADRILGREW